MTQRHRRRAGVVRLPPDGELGPGDPLHARDRAHPHALGLEHRPLLDVQLVVGVGVRGLARHVAFVADALELLPLRLSVDVGAGVGPLDVQGSGPDARRHHGRREAGALFVGPVDDDDRPLGLDAGVVERAHDFQHAEDAEDAEDVVDAPEEGA